MGIFKFFYEIKANASHKRMFKAVMIDNADVLPKASPFIKSIETVQGDGGVGSIKQTNYGDESKYKYMKYRIDHLDHENCASKLTLFEGDVLGDNIESISYDVKFEDSKDGGCVVKFTSEYNTKGDFVLKEVDVNVGKEQSFVLYKAYADYLNANPHVCA
ncbi:major allergen Pru ar 1-like [Olea europaea var. sylvestris]|uniref:Pathogenesis-related STH-2-like n=1 Tax=Olea europaea subsp. europaea TaxID=158383 RepID=A0A8S0RLC9_OLEEU|nr:major allergen Pru ar 1-like [Olea europaea var. sylvestris]CAA2980525.1 pathogenesis-related STH-2-like [Olea europaea subsp. europaea]